MAVHNPTGTSGFYMNFFAVQQPLHNPYLLSFGGNYSLQLSEKPSRSFAYYNGVRYIVLANWGDEWVGVWKSTDGQQWVEVDRAGHLDYSGSGFKEHFAWHDEPNNLMYVAYAYSGSETRIGIFDLAAETWGSEITGGPAPAATLVLTGGTYRDYFPIVRSDDSIVLIWREYNGSNKMRVRMSIYTSGGGWTGTTDIDPRAAGEAPHCAVGAVWLDTSDRVHVLIVDSSRYSFHRSIESDDTVNQHETLPWFTGHSSKLVASAGFGDSNMVAGLNQFSRHAFDDSVPSLMRGTPAEAPEWQDQILSWDYLLANDDIPGSVPIPVSKSTGWWVLLPDSADLAGTGYTAHYLIPITTCGVGSKQLAFRIPGRTQQGVGMTFREDGVDKIAFLIRADDVQSAYIYWETPLSNFIDDSPAGFTRYVY